MELKSETAYTLTLTARELDLLFHGIGRTSVNSRVEAGMTEEESEFFTQLFGTIHRANKNL